MTASSDPPHSAIPYDAYLPSLDGMRAVSIALVMLSHLGLGRIDPGGLGVTVFFFISGFLITRQLLSELARSGTISLLRFTARRALRLYPALLAMVLLGGALFTAVGGVISPGQVAAALLYFSNYMLLAGGFNGPAGFLHPFTILWSLAVEEHFYLLFPLATLLLARRPERFVVAIVATLAAVALWRGIVVHAGIGTLPDRIDYATDTRIDSILYGALLPAVLASRWQPLLRPLLANPILPAAVLLLSLVWRNPTFREVERFSLQGIALLGLMGWLLLHTSAAPARRLLSTPWLRWIGRLSYSLYLWHWTLIACAALLWPERVNQIIAGTAPPTTPTFATAIGLGVTALAAACLSYYAIERPTLRLRHRLGSHA